MRVIRWMLQTEAHERPNVEDLLNLPHVSMRLRERALKRNLQHMRRKEEEVDKKEQKLAQKAREIAQKEKELKEREEALLKLESEIEVMMKEDESTMHDSFAIPASASAVDDSLQFTNRDDTLFL